MSERTRRQSGGFLRSSILWVGFLVAFSPAAWAGDSGDESGKDRPQEQEKAGQQAGEEKDPGEADGKKASDKTVKARVYTNADLKKYRNRVPRRAMPRGRVVSTLHSEPTPGEEKDSGTSTQEKRRRTSELQGEIDQAQRRIAYIDQRLKSIQNPFLPRTQVGEEERQEEAGMDNRQISEKLKAERAGLQSRLAQLRRELGELTAAPSPDSSQNSAGDGSGDTPEP